MPGSVSAGMPEKNASNAASPPADAPMPSTGNPSSAWLKVSGAGVETDMSTGVSIDASAGSAARGTSVSRNGFSFGSGLACFFCLRSVFVLLFMAKFS